MLFALLCKDKPDHLQVRLDNRPDHVAFLRGLNEAGTLKLAGPFLGDDGKPMGSLVVIEAADKTEAASIGAEIPTPRPACSRASRSRPGTGPSTIPPIRQTHRKERVP